MFIRIYQLFFGSQIDNIYVLFVYLILLFSMQWNPLNSSLSSTIEHLIVNIFLKLIYWKVRFFVGLMVEKFVLRNY